MQLHTGPKVKSQLNQHFEDKSSIQNSSFIEGTYTENKPLNSLMQSSNTNSREKMH